jgi:hypothetical protein
MKCGTSALHYYLDLHPDIAMSHPKELNFFVDRFDPARELGPDDPGELARRGRRTGNWRRGVDWYSSHFDAGRPVRGEASPVYSSPGFPAVAERMAEVIPEARLVYMIRDPVERMIAHYIHLRSLGVERRELVAALTAPSNVYLARSRYHSNLVPFLERFDRERILVLRQEDLLRRRKETMRSVFGFAGVEDSFWSERMTRERNITAGKGMGTRLLWRLQKMPAMRLGHRLPHEVKWRIERAFARGGPRARPRAAVGDELRVRVAAELGGEVERIAELTGLDLSPYLEG